MNIIENGEKLAIPICAIAVLGSTFTMGALSQRGTFDNKLIYIGVQLINIICQAFAIATVYLKYHDTEADSIFYLQSSVNILATLNVISILFIDFHILDRFVILDLRLTETRRLILKIVLLSLQIIRILLMTASIIVYMSSGRNGESTAFQILFEMQHIEGNIGLLLGAIYDNAQVFYIAFILRKFNENKDTEGAKRAFKRALLFNACVVSLDWVGLTVNIVGQASSWPSPFKNAMYQISCGLLGIHVFLSPFIFLNFKDIAFAKK